MKNIVFFGDSLTAGYSLPAADSFPARIQEKLTVAGLPYQALNYGVSGETSAGGRQRLPTVLARQAPAIFVLALGANDGLRGIAVRDTVANLRFILHEVRRPLCSGVSGIISHPGPGGGRGLRAFATGRRAGPPRAEPARPRAPQRRRPAPARRQRVGRAGAAAASSGLTKRPGSLRYSEWIAAVGR